MKKRQNDVKGSTVVVGDMPFERAMRIFKRNLAKSKVVQEVKDRQHYVKPSMKRKLAKNAARKRWLKKLASEQLPAKLY